MKQIALMAAALALFSEHANADLDKLINKNVQDATRSYERTLSPVERPREPVQLWLHIRSDSQKKIGEEILKRVKDAKLKERSIEQRPVQTVHIGPQVSQLRYFKTQDEPEARELFAILRRVIPKLELKNFSREYERVTWIKRGHYELWLSPDLVRLEPSR